VSTWLYYVPGEDGLERLVRIADSQTIEREQIRKGLPIRLFSDYLTVPKGTRATVDDVGVMRGVW